MIRTAWMWSILVLALMSSLAAQDPRCTTTLAEAERACNTAVDAARVIHPLAGMLASGGNPVLGSAGTNGRVGRFSITGRLNTMEVSLPDPDSAAEASVPSSFEGLVVSPVIEMSAGLLPGFGNGILAIDLLGSAVLLPTTMEDVTVDEDAPHIGDIALGLGYGARIGIVKGEFKAPSLSLSIMRRSLPRARYGDVEGGDLADFSTDLHATNVRLIAGMSVGLLDLAAGLGMDFYNADGIVRYIDLLGIREREFDFESNRRLAFLNIGFRMGPATLAGEIGYQTGEEMNLSTDFTDFDPSAGHVFWSAGLRFAF